MQVVEQKREVLVVALSGKAGLHRDYRRYLYESRNFSRKGLKELNILHGVTCSGIYTASNSEGGAKKDHEFGSRVNQDHDKDRVLV